MKIGQIVFIQNMKKINTGIIIRSEYEPSTEEHWYEVQCNDNNIHVIPGSLLSVAGKRSGRKNKQFMNIQKKQEKVALLYKSTSKPDKLYI
jgi:hypothetical protein